MKKAVLFLALAATVSFTSCSKDDDNECKSCTASNQKVEICDNGDGTYELTVGGESAGTLDESDLDGLSPQQVVDATCEALNLFTDF